MTQIARTILPALAAAALLLCPTAHAADTSHLTMVPDAAAVQWQPGPANLPKGIQIAALSGDPAKPGPFTLRLKVPANTVIAPHTHAKLESVTVLDGSVYHETGRTFRRDAGTKMGTAGYFSLPALMPHTVWTEADPAIIQVTGSGPFGVDYINPKDDPSKQ